MKVAIIAANNLRVSPYVFFYTKILDEMKIPYEVIYPKRNGYIDEVDFNAKVLDWNTSKSSLYNYVKYRKNIIKTISQENYDFIIALTTINAVMLSDWLKRHYNKKYIIDIRDYTYESNPIYFYFEQKAIKNSRLNVISSEKFRTFLPKGEYNVCHNINTKKMDTRLWKKSMSSIIKIGYVGTLAYKEQCKKMMDLINKDSRFILNFHGTSGIEEELKNYAKGLSCDRIKFYGGYMPNEKEKIILDQDILFNAYGNDSLLVKCALSNKMYDSLTYRKLLLNSPGTFMDEFAGPISFAIDFNKSKDLDKLYNWYNNLNENEINTFIDETLGKVIKENENTNRNIKDVLTHIS